MTITVSADPYVDEHPSLKSFVETIKGLRSDIERLRSVAQPTVSAPILQISDVVAEKSIEPVCGVLDSEVVPRIQDLQSRVVLLETRNAQLEFELTIARRSLEEACEKCARLESKLQESGPVSSPPLPVSASVCDGRCEFSSKYKKALRFIDRMRGQLQQIHVSASGSGTATKAAGSSSSARGAKASESMIEPEMLSEEGN